MKFVIATVSLLVLVFVMGGTIVVVGGVLTPKVITAGVYRSATLRYGHTTVVARQTGASMLIVMLPCHHFRGAS
jgi:hypothetical protein